MPTSAHRVHEPTTIMPAPATPITLPASNSAGLSEETRISMMRTDFSSIVLVSNICALVNTAIHNS